MTPPAAPLRPAGENPAYLSEQLITYIGNKRALLPLIREGVAMVQARTGRKRLSSFDVFSGSGIVSRLLKGCSSRQVANDLEDYARVISACYLSNARDVDREGLSALHGALTAACADAMARCLSPDGSRLTGEAPGFISEYYAPRDLHDVRPGERCFYTPYNACYIDCMRQAIDRIVPEALRPFFVAPLLSEASVHANTGGVFKGFYKDSRTGLGKFGGTGANALGRIQGHISLPLPVLSRSRSAVTVFQADANELVRRKRFPQVDLAYIDPPYNQHPYGSNYFMLNLIANYERPAPELLSRVSGIPRDWNRSLYNRRRRAAETFRDLVEHIPASHLIVSFNNEGFINREEMLGVLEGMGSVTVLERDYAAYRASRNLSSRSLRTTEYLYVVEKR